MFSLYAIYTMKMNNDNNAIYGFDVNLICEFFLNTKRQGPGSPDVTFGKSSVSCPLKPSDSAPLC